ncbi:MAG: DUF308 domain-containing protein [Lachnospiraceae bacterium]|nr:DUF308 domain-containing protein [Lachnospiraceae bacterium]
MFVKKKDDDKSKKNKMLEWDNIIVALVYIILGVFMMVHPRTFYKGFTTALMIILIGMGISKIASYFIIKKNTEIGTTMKLISGICLIVFGILVRVLLGSLVAMIIGLFLVYGGISKLVLGLSIKNVDKTQGKTLIIAGVINMIIGIIAVLLPFKTTSVVIIIFGIAFVLSGIMEVISVFKVYKVRKAFAAADGALNQDYKEVE